MNKNDSFWSHQTRNKKNRKKNIAIAVINVCCGIKFDKVLTILLYC